MKRPRVIFYAFAAYVFISFIWWFYLHIQNFEQIFDLTISETQKTYLAYDIEKSYDIDYEVENSTTYRNAMFKLNLDRYMIIGEAFIFLLILIFGFYKLYTSFEKEIELAEKQRNFMLSITHELKSPIAGIKLTAESILKRNFNIDIKMQRKLMVNSLRDANRLKELVENILMAAKIESKDISLSRYETNLSHTVNEISERYEDNSSIARQFVFDIEPGLFVQGDKLALSSIALNLIDNAVKYSPKDTRIDVIMWSSNNMVLLKVSDQGFGIAEDEKRKVFDKFYRIGSEDRRKTKGTGLGLFLVKELVDFHGGRIVITDNKPQGSVFTVELPRYTPTKSLTFAAERKTA